MDNGEGRSEVPSRGYCGTVNTRRNRVDWRRDSASGDSAFSGELRALGRADNSLSLASGRYGESCP